MVMIVMVMIDNGDGIVDYHNLDNGDDGDGCDDDNDDNGDGSDD